MAGVAATFASSCIPIPIPLLVLHPFPRGHHRGRSAHPHQFAAPQPTARFHLPNCPCKAGGGHSRQSRPASYPPYCSRGLRSLDLDQKALTAPAFRVLRQHLLRPFKGHALARCYLTATPSYPGRPLACQRLGQGEPWGSVLNSTKPSTPEGPGTDLPERSSCGDAQGHELSFSATQGLEPALLG